MTTKPELKLGSHLLPGLAAVGLFVVMAAVFLTASFPQPQGFPDGANVTASLGYAMFNLDFGQVASEGFLVAFEIIDLVLVAALVGSVMLARREHDQGESVELVADGGRRLLKALTGGRDGDGGDR
jgi:NADH-quinone oxidoreductase subunit J